MTEDEMRALDIRLAVAMGYRTTEERYPCLVHTAGGRIVGTSGREDAETCWRLDCPRFCTDGAAMLTLMEWLTANGWGWCLEAGASYVVTIWPALHGGDLCGDADTAPLALALAAGAALAARP